MKRIVEGDMVKTTLDLEMVRYDFRLKEPIDVKVVAGCIGTVSRIMEPDGIEYLDAWDENTWVEVDVIIEGELWAATFPYTALERIEPVLFV